MIYCIILTPLANQIVHAFNFITDASRTFVKDYEVLFMIINSGGLGSLDSGVASD